MGNLRRISPISRRWGFDRGVPVDRYYIAQFIAGHAQDIHGTILEIGTSYYSRQFGRTGSRISVLHVEPGHPEATIVADLTSAEQIPSNTFDCIVFTQTLQCIYDVQAAIRTLHRILKGGGKILATMPGITKNSGYDAQRWGDYWRFTRQSAVRLFGEIFQQDKILARGYGNVLSATAFLYGLAAQELRPNELDVCDPDFEVLIGIRAEKEESASAAP